MCGISAQNFGFPETGRKSIRRFGIFLSDGLSLSGRLKKSRASIPGFHCAARAVFQTAYFFPPVLLG